MRPNPRSCSGRQFGTSRLPGILPPRARIGLPGRLGLPRPASVQHRWRGLGQMPAAAATRPGQNSPGLGGRCRASPVWAAPPALPCSSLMYQRTACRNVRSIYRVGSRRGKMGGGQLSASESRSRSGTQGFPPAQKERLANLLTAQRSRWIPGLLSESVKRGFQSNPAFRSNARMLLRNFLWPDA